MLYAVPRCNPVARATSLAFNGRSEACSVRSTLAAATAPTGLPGLAPFSAAVMRRAEQLEASGALAWSVPEDAECGRSIAGLFKRIDPCWDAMMRRRRDNAMQIVCLL